VGTPKAGVAMCVAVCCSVLQYFAGRCSVLQQGGTHYDLWARREHCVAACCSMLQRIAAS